MRLISWNCNMKFREKWKAITCCNPDILLIQECENIDYRQLSIAGLTDFRWIGDNSHKGLGIFTFNNISITDMIYDPHYRYIARADINLPTVNTIIAVWAMNNTTEPEKRYSSQLGLFLEKYPEFFDEQTIIAGDFNSNAIWDGDRPRKLFTHSDIANILARQNMFSIHHEQSMEEPGHETAATFYMHRKQSRPYHIDYIFANRNIIDNASRLTIGTFNEWIPLSDHMPLICDIS